MPADARGDGDAAINGKVYVLAGGVWIVSAAVPCARYCRVAWADANGRATEPFASLAPTLARPCDEAVVTAEGQSSDFTASAPLPGITRTWDGGVMPGFPGEDAVLVNVPAASTSWTRTCVCYTLLARSRQQGTDSACG